MKYTCTVEIPLSRKECIDLWFDESQFDKWQEGFQYKKWIEGEPNQKDSKSEILITQGKRKIELAECILENNLPDWIEGRYVHVHMTNTQKTTFEVVSPDVTMIRSDVDYTAFHAFMPKLMAKLFPGMFKKQSQKWLDEFKLLAEGKK